MQPNIHTRKREESGKESREQEKHQRWAVPYSPPRNPLVTPTRESSRESSVFFPSFNFICSDSSQPFNRWHAGAYLSFPSSIPWGLQTQINPTVDLLSPLFSNWSPFQNVSSQYLGTDSNWDSQYCQWKPQHGKQSIQKLIN